MTMDGIMNRKAQWRDFYSERLAAMHKGEEIAATYDFGSPPVDVFRILKSERRLIHPAGEDFGDAFDGRIRFLGKRFLLCYNTKYNAWPHKGEHHSKVLFSIAHELGHYFLDDHRRCLVTNRQPHGSFSEFSSHELIEQQADHFATGLLMPESLLRRHINQINFPDVDYIRDVVTEFDVSLTGLLARWAQLTHFPCATIGTLQGKIRFGWASESLRKFGVFRLRRGDRPDCRSFLGFAERCSPVSAYKQGDGVGDTDYWFDSERHSFGTRELYFAIPHTGLIWAFLMCDESDFERPWEG